MKQKTASEWFKQLPPTIRKMATDSTRKIHLKELSYNLNTSLMASFVWTRTPIGHNFWESVYYNVNNQNKLSELEIEAIKFLKQKHDTK